MVLHLSKVSPEDPHSNTDVWNVCVLGSTLECTWSIGPFGPSSAMCIGRQAATAAVAQHPPDSAPLAEASSLMWGDAHAWMDMHASVRHANACVRSMSMNMELARLCTQWAWCLERKARCVVAKMNEESIGRQVSHSSTRT